jgi:hypothetical protein
MSILRAEFFEDDRRGCGAWRPREQSGWPPRPLGLPIGLQLYSVRELLPKDFDGTLAKVRAAGYTEVEAAGYYDKTAADFRKAMDKAGLRCISTHHRWPCCSQLGTS